MRPTEPVIVRAKRDELAGRIQGAVEALRVLRVNSIGPVIDELEGIATEVRNAPDNVDPSSLQQAGTKAVQVLLNLLDQIASAPGGRVVLCGAVGSILGSVGWPATIAFATAMSAWLGKDAFMAAMEMGKSINAKRQTPRRSREKSKPPLKA